MIGDRKFFLRKYYAFRRLAEFYLTLYLIAEGYSDHDAMARVGVDPETFHEIMNEFELKEHVMEAKRLGKMKKTKKGLKSALDSHKRWLSHLEGLEKEVV